MYAYKYNYTYTCVNTFSHLSNLFFKPRCERLLAMPGRGGMELLRKKIDNLLVLRKESSIGFGSAAPKTIGLDLGSPKIEFPVGFIDWLQPCVMLCYAKSMSPTCFTLRRFGCLSCAAGTSALALLSFLLVSCILRFELTRLYIGHRWKVSD